MFHRYVQTSDQWAHWSDIPSTMITTDSCITPNILLLSDVSQSILLLNRLTACFSLLAICFIFSLLIDTCSSQDKSWCENQINVSWYIWSNLQFFKMYSHKKYLCIFVNVYFMWNNVRMWVLVSDQQSCFQHAKSRCLQINSEINSLSTIATANERMPKFIYLTFTIGNFFSYYRWGDF